MWHYLGSGTTANVYGSKGGTSSTATLMNGATWDNGAHGSAIKLDGKNDYVNGPAIKGTPTLKDLTACMWVKFDSTNSGGGRQYVIDTQYHKYSLIIDETKSGSAIKVQIRPQRTNTFCVCKKPCGNIRCPAKSHLA